jgi:hypothetical protein
MYNGIGIPFIQITGKSFQLPIKWSFALDWRGFGGIAVKKEFIV